MCDYICVYIYTIHIMKKWCKKDSGAKKILSGKVIFKGVASSMREGLLIFALCNQGHIHPEKKITLLSHTRFAIGCMNLIATKFNYPFKIPGPWSQLILCPDMG